METVTFVVPSLAERRDALDLGNALFSIKGVERVDADPERHTVSIRYDTHYAGEETLRVAVCRSGYPVDAPE